MSSRWCVGETFMFVHNFLVIMPSFDDNNYNEQPFLHRQFHFTKQSRKKEWHEFMIILKWFLLHLFLWVFCFAEKMSWSLKHRCCSLSTACCRIHNNLTKAQVPFKLSSCVRERLFIHTPYTVSIKNDKRR